jgi:hypothetical protein
MNAGEIEMLRKATGKGVVLYLGTEGGVFRVIGVVGENAMLDCRRFSPKQPSEIYLTGETLDDFVMAASIRTMAIPFWEVCG